MLKEVARLLFLGFIGGSMRRVLLVEGFFFSTKKTRRVV